MSSGVGGSRRAIAATRPDKNGHKEGRETRWALLSAEGVVQDSLANLRVLGLYAEGLSRLVRRSQESAFALRAAARRRREGLSESSPVRSAGN
jgi:hypothetical protein